MIGQTHARDRGSLALLTSVLALLLAACGGAEDASPENAVLSEAMAGDSELDSSGGTASFTFGDETIAFPVEMCTNPGGGTFVFMGSATRADGEAISIMIRSTTGRSQAFIKIGPPGSADVREWRGGSETTSASIDGAVLTASGEAVELDSILASTGRTRTFSVTGPCGGPG